MEQPPIQSIDRVFDIVEVLAENPRGMTLTQISTSVSLHKSTVHRMMLALISRGYVDKDEQTGRYKLTMRLFSIGSRVLGGFDILSVARPYLEQLSEYADEAVHLVVRDSENVVYLLKEDSSRSLVRSGTHYGFSNPMYCTGVGKSILAYLSDEDVADIWARTKVTAYTSRTITSFALLKEELSVIRVRGYAIDDEEFEDGLRCIACAIFDYTQQPIAAISISAPITRMSMDRVTELAPQITQAAHEISRQMGFQK